MQKKSQRNPSYIRAVDSKRRPDKTPHKRRRRQSGLQRDLRRFVRWLRAVAERLLFSESRLYLIVAVVLLAAVLGVTFWVNTRHNAYEVMVGEAKVGVIAMSKTITADDLLEATKIKIKNDMATEIQISENVTLVSVHAKKTNINSYDHVISEIYKAIDYSVEAAVIMVNDEDVAILKNKAEADELYNKLLDRNNQEGLNIVKREFVENVMINTRFVKPDEIISSDKAYEILSRDLETEEKYTVVDNDTLLKIASKKGMSLEDLLAANPGTTVDTVIRVGSKLNVVLPKPFLSVKTVEEITYEEAIPVPASEIRENPNESKSYKKVAQQGKEGKKKVTAQIIRVNGFETERVVVNEEVLVPATVEIVEVGTKTTATRR